MYILGYIYFKKNYFGENILIVKYIIYINASFNKTSNEYYEIFMKITKHT